MKLPEWFWTCSGRFSGEERRRIQVLSEENTPVAGHLLDQRENAGPGRLSPMSPGAILSAGFRKSFWIKGKRTGWKSMLRSWRSWKAGRRWSAGFFEAVRACVQSHASAGFAQRSRGHGPGRQRRRRRGGRNAMRMNSVLKFLDRGSQVKLGDLVVTSGLGRRFPAGDSRSAGWKGSSRIRGSSFCRRSFGRARGRTRSASCWCSYRMKKALSLLFHGLDPSLGAGGRAIIFWGGRFSPSSGS